MFITVILGLILVVGFIGLLAGIFGKSGAGVAVAAGSVVLTLIIGGFAGTYTQGEGEAKVIRSFTGAQIGVDTTAGMDWKKPYYKAVTYDTKNNILEYDDIKFTDKDGATGNLSLRVTYSLDPASTGTIDKEYKSQGQFEKDLVKNDVDAVVRTVPGKYTAVQILGEREMISNEILKAIEKRWEAWGVRGVQVALGNIEFSPAIMEQFNALAGEKTKAQAAKAATLTAEETAKQKVAQAKGEYDSNILMEKSLTPAVLESRRIEMQKVAAEHGNMILDVGDSNVLLSVDSKK